MTALERLQRWFCSNCDGDWEYSYGVSIETSDNPGWIVEIDLAGTDMEQRTFERVRSVSSDQDYLFCSIEAAGERVLFRGASDAMKLEKLLLIFLDWVEAGTESEGAVTGP